LRFGCASGPKAGRAKSCRRRSPSGSRISAHHPAPTCSLVAVINNNNNDNNNGVHSRHCATERRAFGAMIEREDAKVH
jgi:hypothetical protein